MGWRRTWLVVLALGLVLAPTAALAQDESAEHGPGQQKHVTAVAMEYGVDEAEVLALRAAGAGWGAIRHAYALAAANGISVEEALTQIETGDLEGKPVWAGGPKHAVPPGQAKKFAVFSDFDGETLQELRLSGYGWGVIRRAVRLAAGEGISVSEALEQITADED